MVCACSQIANVVNIMPKNLHCPTIDYMMFGYMKESLQETVLEEEDYFEDDQEGV